MLSDIHSANHADDTIPYVIGYGAKETINFLKTASDNFFCWYASNQMKASPDK